MVVDLSYGFVIVALASFNQFIFTTLTIVSLKYISSSIYSIIENMTVMHSFVYAIVFLGKSLNKVQVFGALLVVSMCIVLVLNK